MAKGNLMMGTLRGRVGASVFYVKQGVQNQIKHQTEIANPKTSAQCLHRSKFAAAGKFYTHGTQALFKFAFENKKAGESDFNAFMKANMDIAYPMSKFAIDNPDYPIVNNWLMTRGTLTPVRSYTDINAETNILVTNIVANVAQGDTITTVADLARAIIDGVNIKENDILTFVLIHSFVDAQTYPAINPYILLQQQNAWNIVQIKLSSTDLTQLSRIGITPTVAEGYVRLTYTKAYSKNYTSFVGGTTILSRNTRSGLKVSTNRLDVTSNDEYQPMMREIWEYAQSEQYINSVIPTWQGSMGTADSTDVILEGALVGKSGIDSGMDLQGFNPIQGAETQSAAKVLTLPFDPRNGYFVATAGQLTADEAIQDADGGEVFRYYYNRKAGMFIQWGSIEDNLGIQVIDNGNGTFTLWQLNPNQLYIYITKWVSDTGQSISFSRLGE